MSAGPGRLVVAGLGPAGPDWLTPEASQALAEATDVVGYMVIDLAAQLRRFESAQPDVL